MSALLRTYVSLCLMVDSMGGAGATWLLKFSLWVCNDRQILLMFFARQRKGLVA